MMGQTTRGFRLTPAHNFSLRAQVITAIAPARCRYRLRKLYAFEDLSDGYEFLVAEVTSKPADDFALHFGEEVLEHLGARFCGFDEDTAAHVWVALTRDQTTLFEAGDDR